MKVAVELRDLLGLGNRTYAYLAFFIWVYANSSVIKQNIDHWRFSSFNLILLFKLAFIIDSDHCLLAMHDLLAAKSKLSRAELQFMLFGQSSSRFQLWSIAVFSKISVWATDDK